MFQFRYLVTKKKNLTIRKTFSTTYAHTMAIVYLLTINTYRIYLYPFKQKKNQIPYWSAQSSWNETSLEKLKPKHTVLPKNNPITLVNTIMAFYWLSCLVATWTIFDWRWKLLMTTMCAAAAAMQFCKRGYQIQYWIFNTLNRFATPEKLIYTKRDKLWNFTSQWKLADDFLHLHIFMRVISLLIYNSL